MRVLYEYDYSVEATTNKIVVNRGCPSKFGSCKSWSVRDAIQLTF
jgi:hypothetical protein